MFIFIKIFADYVVYKLLGLSSGTNIAESLDFFIYNSAKVLLLIIIIGFFIGIFRGYITPAKTRKILSGKNKFFGTILSSLFAVITPVESFSVVPVFIGFLEAGIPTGVCFTYLITAPMTNEVAFVLFLGLFGLKIAFAYYATSIIVGLIGGPFIGLLKSEKYIEPFVYKEGLNLIEKHRYRSFIDILKEAKSNSFDFFKNFYLYILLGVGIASIVHGFIPANYIIKYIGFDNIFAVPIAVILVIFFYVNIAMALPMILIFANHGLPLGTLLAFTMAVTATSIPELLILKRALKMPLLISYLAILLIGIIFAGYLLNFIFR